jgi:hypothetical protein
MGVNVHMEYTKTPYKNYALINQKLEELGMHHFRDEINNSDPAFVKELKRIGRLGYKLCGVIEGGNDYPPAGQRLDPNLVVPMIRNLRPTIDAVEGPNEPDDGGFVYGRKLVPYPQGAIDESVDLWHIVKGDPQLRALPVLAMSEGNAQDYTQLAALISPPFDLATFGNMHAYQGGGLGDNLLGDWYIPFSRDFTGRKPLWTTEMGYHNNTRYLGQNQQQGVSERAAAIYLPIAFLSGFNREVRRTFSYELIDEVNDPHLTRGGEGHFGLLHYDGTPKPAYTALKNLVAILRDSEGHGFEPDSLTIQFSGAPSTMRFTLLQKSNSDYYLALWNDVEVYRLATPDEHGFDLYPEGVPISVTFSEPKAVTVYAPNDAETGPSPTVAYTFVQSSRSITLRLPPHVLLLRITDERQ